MSLAERFPVLDKLGALLPRDRIPFVPQTTPTDCGVACLAMVLAYYGREARIEELRDVLGAGRDGASALSIVDGAAAYGLLARGLRVEPKDLVEMQTPAVIHWRMRHFVVLDEVTPEGARIIDPAIGPRLVTWDELHRSFTGVAIVFDKTDKFVAKKDGTTGALLDHLKRMAFKSPLIGRVVVTSVLLQVFAMMLPLVNGRIVDRVLPRNDGHLLMVLTIGVIATAAFSFLAVLVRAWLLVELRTRLDVQMTLGFLDHMLRLPYAFFQRRQAGDLMMRVNSNATIREILTSGVLSGLIDTVLVVCYLALLIAMSAKLAALAVGLVLLQSLVFVVLRNKQRELAAGSLAKQAEAESWLVELLGGMETLKATGTEHRAAQRWASLYVDVMNLTLKRSSLGGISDSIMGTLRMATPFLLLFVGSIEVMNGSMSLGTMLSANAFAAGFVGPVTSLVGILSQLQVVKTYLARIEDVMVAKPEQYGVDVRMPPVLTGHVMVENVSFRYGPKSPLVVKDASFHVKPGEMFALVGKSGCGKSSLASLLVGLHLPTNGAVKYDGHRLQDLELGALRRQIGVVVQKPYIFGATVRANITMFDPSVPQEDIERASRMACIHDDIMKMPLGYDTPLTAAGSSLSGGQRQRIALARALVRNPRILLLDEATSALDNVTEQQVMASLRQSGATIFVVAHRLTTIKTANFILVMEDGALIEGGTHDQLLRMNGLYTELVRAQDPSAAQQQQAQQPAQRAGAPMAPQAQPQMQRPPMQAQRAQQQWQQPQHPARPQQKRQAPQAQRPQQQQPTPQQHAFYALPKAAAKFIANDDADPTVRRSAFSRPGSSPSAENVSDDDATILRQSSEQERYERSGERHAPRHENVIQLAPRRAGGGHR